MGDKILHATEFGFLFWCPGCKCGHGVWLDKPNERTNARWTWDGNAERPTFSPSILCQGVEPITDEQHARIMAGEVIPPVPRVCHSFVRGGFIQFLGDCTHALAGQTVPMEPF